MTDRESLVAMLTKLGLIRVERGDLPDGRWPEVGDREFQVRPEEGGGSSVVVGSGDGYSGFYVTFDFDERGGVLSHGIWE